MSHLSHAVQKMLVRRAQGGDQLAREQLVKTNQGFISQTAKTYLGRGVEFEELMQEGSIGLLTAIEKYDHGKGVVFMTYAAWWIKQAMGRACERQGSQARMGFRVPAHVTYAVAKIRKIMPSLEAELGRTPTTAELAGVCEVTEDTVEMAMMVMNTSQVSIEAGADNDEFSLVQLTDEGPAADDVVAGDDQQQALRSMLQRLPDRQRILLERRFGIGDADETSERKLAEEWNTTRAQLQSLRAQAFRSLRGDVDVAALVPETPAGERLLAESMVSHSCGHLRAEHDLNTLDLPASFRMAGGAASGRHGAFWYLISNDGYADQLQLHIQDGPTGEVMSLPDALDRFPGEQRMELIEFAANLPLQRADCCEECR